MIKENVAVADSPSKKAVEMNESIVVGREEKGGGVISEIRYYFVLSKMPKQWSFVLLVLFSAFQFCFFSNLLLRTV